MWNDLPLILAQEDAPPPSLDAPPPAAQEGALTTEDGTPLPGTDAPNAQPQGLFGGPMFWMLLAIMLLFVFLMGGGRREKKKRAAMLAAMGKGDYVQTIGGIRGTVLDIKDDAVTLKVDENANARLTFAASAIQTVLESKDDGEEPK